MKITQHDIAQLPDRQVKQMVLMYDAAAREQRSNAAPFWRALSVALVHAMRERRQLVYAAEYEMADDGEDGSLLDDDSETQLLAAEGRHEAGHADEPP